MENKLIVAVNDRWEKRSDVMYTRSKGRLHIINFLKLRLIDDWKTE